MENLIELYRYLLPYFEQQMISPTQARVIISFDGLVKGLAVYKGISFEEELQNFKEFKNKTLGIVNMEFNEEFDQYEEVKD